MPHGMYCNNQEIQKKEAISLCLYRSVSRIWAMGRSKGDFIVETGLVTGLVPDLVTGLAPDDCGDWQRIPIIEHSQIQQRDIRSCFR